MVVEIHHRGRKPAQVYLREWLDYRNITAEQLAGRLETSKGTVSKLMNGHQKYTLDWLEAIAFALDCDVDALLRPPTAPTADELLAKMAPEAREAAMNVLVSLARPRTGTDG